MICLIIKFSGKSLFQLFGQKCYFRPIEHFRHPREIFPKPPCIQNMLASASADGSIQLWKPEMVSSFHERGGLDNGEFDVESEEFGISDRFEKDGVEDDDVYKGLLAKNANQEDMEEKHNGKDKEEQMREIKDEQEKWMRWPTLKDGFKILNKYKRKDKNI